jgi:hypothetical protein
MAPEGAPLLIQAGNREPRLWRALSHAAGAGIEGPLCAVTHPLNLVSIAMQKQKPGAELRPGANRQFQFPE